MDNGIPHRQPLIDAEDNPGPNLDRPRACYALLCIGHEHADPLLVRATLDTLTARVIHSHRLEIVGRGEDDAILSEWVRAHHRYGVRAILEPVHLDDGRFKEVRWAMKVCGTGNAVVIFGSPDRWRVLLRMAAAAGLGVRVVGLGS